MKKKILVVDDFKNSLAILKMTLEMKKFEVVTATNGQEALALFNQQAFDLLISDYNMPVLNGLDLVKQIKSSSANHKFPIVIVSTDVDENKKREVLRAGATFWLKKPFKMEELMNVVERIVL